MVKGGGNLRLEICGGIVVVMLLLTCETIVLKLSFSTFDGTRCLGRCLLVLKRVNRWKNYYCRLCISLLDSDLLFKFI